MDGESLSEFFDQQSEFDETGLASSEDIFSVLEALEGISEFNPITPVDETGLKDGGGGGGGGDELVSTRKCKRQKVNNATKASSEGEAEANNTDGQQKISHITVERNRRKQMNGHLTILRSLMPCFYVKRGDQASIIGGVVDYISELQQVLQSLEAKKQRKVYSEVLSPRLISPLSPRKPPLSPRILTLPISPRTPQPTSPYKPWLLQPQPPSGNNYLSPTMANHPHDPSPSSSTNSSSIDTINELVANSRSAIADVEVRFSGPNVLLKTISQRIPGHAVKIISALEDLSLEVLHVNINTIEERMLNSFTIKIGIECQLSADELAHLIQQTFLVT